MLLPVDILLVEPAWIMEGPYLTNAAIWKQKGYSSGTGTTTEAKSIDKWTWPVVRQNSVCLINCLLELILADLPLSIKTMLTKEGF
jgi:hypothetical protein